MTTARASLINVDATPYYHCVSRCVRRSFLCGFDNTQGKCFEHRRGWIEKRLLALAKAFCIDVCAYAIMSNHYHVVLHINIENAKTLTPIDVAERWLAFHQGPVLIQRFMRGEEMSEAENERCMELIETWRERLTSISWFMRTLNQYIAAEANREDQCTGHFWEGRFKSQALLDEKALAAAMAYVDLNPIRADITDSPETSEYTSVKTRIEALKNDQVNADGLYVFAGYPRKDQPAGIPFRLLDYLELVDWTGRQLRDGKRGQIDDKLPPLLERLGIESSLWLRTASNIETGNLVGSENAVKAALPHLQRQRVSGIRLPDS
ncbi:Mobile element protein [Grimontia indica]|uniref:Mobile element protein n=1 Tax=Grimontia indica TaxID=1056512 RepID=R1IVP3_9GAMM|nr:MULTISPECIES: transposase [Grimontia]EOD79355.1 Mobile element protein [Grimontia indica]